MDIRPEDFYPFYIQTCVERDVRLIRNIEDQALFIRFIRQYSGECLSDLWGRNGFFNTPGTGHWLEKYESFDRTAFVEFPSWSLTEKLI